MPVIHHIRVRLRDESGQAAIEYALVLPAVILILFLLVNFAFVFNYWNNEQHLASVAARFAAVGVNPGTGGQSFKDAILSEADADSLKNNASFCVSYPNGRAIGQPVQVQITYQYTPFSIFPAITLHGTATHRLETASTTIPSGPDTC